MENEVALMQKLGHPNIVAYKDSYTKDGNLNIVMSYCEGGDMYNRIKETEGKHFPENVRISFLEMDANQFSWFLIGWLSWCFPSTICIIRRLCIEI
jgi:serine/threonine protein kinase